VEEDQPAGAATGAVEVAPAEVIAKGENPEPDAAADLAIALDRVPRTDIAGNGSFVCGHVTSRIPNPYHRPFERSIGRAQAARRRQVDDGRPDP
jgi:hypothetical protein